MGSCKVTDLIFTESCLDFDLQVVPWTPTAQESCLQSLAVLFLISTHPHPCTNPTDQTTATPPPHPTPPPPKLSSLFCSPVQFLYDQHFASLDLSCVICKVGKGGWGNNTRRPAWLLGHCDFYTDSLALGQSSTKSGKPQHCSGTPRLGKGLKGS